MAVVGWNVTVFRESYPQFTEEDYTDGQLENAFNVACIILDNTETSIIPYDLDNGIYTRRTLLYLLVCHIATLEKWAENGQSGAMTSASEGSVSTGFSTPQSTTDAGWYNQTPCGAMFWQAISAYKVGPKYYSLKHFHPWG